MSKEEKNQKKNEEGVAWKLVSGVPPIEPKNSPDITDIFDKIEKVIRAIVRLPSLTHKGHVYALLEDMNDSINELKDYYEKQKQEP